MACDYYWRLLCSLSSLCCCPLHQSISLSCLSVTGGRINRERSGEMAPTGAEEDLRTKSSVDIKVVRKIF